MCVCVCVVVVELDCLDTQTHTYRQCTMKVFTIMLTFTHTHTHTQQSDHREGEDTNTHVTVSHPLQSTIQNHAYPLIGLTKWSWCHSVPHCSNPTGSSYSTGPWYCRPCHLDHPAQDRVYFHMLEMRKHNWLLKCWLGNYLFWYEYQRMR